MRYPTLVLLSFCFLAGAAAAYAADDTLDCSRRSLREAVRDVHEENQTIRFTGVCAGPIVIRVDGLALKGVGTAIIDGGGRDAVTVHGASRVSLTNIEVRNGLDGIVAVNGAHLTLTGVSAHDNFVFGISLQTASSAVLSDVTATANGVHGLDLETGSAATVTGTLTASTNRVFGINVNGSSNINVHHNSGSGVRVLSGSTLTLTNQARVVSNQNAGTGLVADNGVGLTLVNSTITGNTVKDIQLTFGARADLRTLVFGTFTCDATVLVRGTSGITCPH